MKFYLYDFYRDHQIQNIKQVYVKNSKQEKAALMVIDANLHTGNKNCIYIHLKI